MGLPPDHSDSGSSCPRPAPGCPVAPGSGRLAGRSAAAGRGVARQEALHTVILRLTIPLTTIYFQILFRVSTGQKPLGVNPVNVRSGLIEANNAPSTRRLLVTIHGL